MAKGTFKGAVSGGRGRRGAATAYQPIISHTTRGERTRLVIDKESPNKSPRKKARLLTDEDQEGSHTPYEAEVEVEPLKLQIGKVRH